MQYRCVQYGQKNVGKVGDNGLRLIKKQVLDKKSKHIVKTRFISKVVIFLQAL